MLGRGGRRMPRDRPGTPFSLIGGKQNGKKHLIGKLKAEEEKRSDGGERGWGIGVQRWGVQGRVKQKSRAYPLEWGKVLSQES